MGVWGGVGEGGRRKPSTVPKPRQGEITQLLKKGLRKVVTFDSVGEKKNLSMTVMKAWMI